MTTIAGVFRHASPVRYTMNLMTANNTGETHLFVKSDTCRICGSCSIKEERMAAICADELDMSVAIIDSQIIVTEEKA